MSSLITKWKKGRPYLYWVRSARVKGQPRIVEQIYLGPQERVMEHIRVQRTAAALQGDMPQLRTVQTREFGASALFYTVAQELGLIDLINAYVPPAPPGRRTSLSVGHYLLLAALNRATWPKSKRAFAEWYQSTVLARVVPAAAEELSSQRFWDHMDVLEEAHFAPLQEALLARIRARSPWESDFWSMIPPTTIPSFIPSTAGLAFHSVAETSRSALTCVRSPWPWWWMRSRVCPSTTAARRAIPQMSSPWGRAWRGCSVPAALRTLLPTSR